MYVGYISYTIQNVVLSLILLPESFTLSVRFASSAVRSVNSLAGKIIPLFNCPQSMSLAFLLQVYHMDL